MNRTILTVSILLTSLVGADTHAGTVFHDDFDNGNDDGWTTTFGTWDPSPGWMEVVELEPAPPLGGDHVYAYAGDATWTDYTYDLDLTFGTGITEFYVAFRANPLTVLSGGVGEQYVISVDGDNDLVRLRYTTATGPTTVQTTPFVLLDQTTYHMTIQIDGNEAMVWVDDNLLLSYTFAGNDPIYASGLIGVGYKSDEGPDGAWFDNVVVTTCADLDGDGMVGIGDFLLVLAQWGPCPPDCFADVDGDGLVGINDFLLVLAEWGPCR